MTAEVLLAAVSSAIGAALLQMSRGRPLPRPGTGVRDPRGAGPGQAWLRSLAPGRERRSEEATAVALADFAEAWAAELRAGRAPGQALGLAAAEVTDGRLVAALAPAVAAAGLGADPADALRSGGAEPGCGLLRLLAATWTVGAGSGAALADAVDRIAETGRADLRQRAEIAAHLAAPRATARMLAMLPGFGWLLGTALGARPFDFLLLSWPGRCCGVAGLGLVVVGLRWTTGLARRAEQPP